MTNLKLYLPILLLSNICLFGSAAVASEIIYTPVNPSFGGNPNNGGFLLSLANSQKQFEKEQDEDTPLQEFNERLQRSLLSRITSVITRDIVDINGNITPGIFETVDYIIEVVDEGDGLITITTTDRVTGESTMIQVNNEDI